MEDHVPRHAQMGAWVLINDRWYYALAWTGMSRFDGRKKGVCADGLPCGNRLYMFVIAVHRDGTRQRSDVIVVSSGEVGVQVANRS